MWTKRYITKPTKEEYFKTKHPIASFCMISPILVYDWICLRNDMNHPWMLDGIIGCLIFGEGLRYTVALALKVYNKWFLPIVCDVLGMVLIVISLIFAW